MLQVINSKKYFRKRGGDKKVMPLYHHFTVAVDTNNIRIVFKDVKDTILKRSPYASKPMRFKAQVGFLEYIKRRRNMG